MKDITDGALKGKGNILADVAAGRKAKKNIFDDVIARRQDEGNYLRTFFPVRRNEMDSKVKWVRLATLALTVVFGGGMLYLVLSTGRIEGPEGASHPGGVGGARPVAAPGRAESGAPTGNVKPKVRKIRDRGATVYRPPLPEFTPLKKLDPEILDEVWDDDRVLRNTPWIAHNIKGEDRVVDHVYRFLRTHTPEELKAKADPSLSHRDMMTNPEFYRGKVVNMRAVILRVYKIYGWYDKDDKDSKVPQSGVLDTTMLFVRSADRRGTHIYVLLVAEPSRNFRERDIVEFAGVFMKRFPYRRKDNKWETHPLLLGMKAPIAKVTPQDSLHLTVAIVLVAVIAMIVLYFTVRGETRESEDKRKERLDRRRTGRDRLQQRLKSSREQPGNGEGGDPDYVRDDGNGDEGGDGEPESSGSDRAADEEDRS